MRSPHPPVSKQMCGPLNFFSSIADCNQRLRLALLMNCDQSDSTNKNKVFFSRARHRGTLVTNAASPGKAGAQSRLRASQDSSSKKKPSTGKRNSNIKVPPTQIKLNKFTQKYVV